MVQSLKHFTMRLWFSIAFGGLIGLQGLSYLDGFLKLQSGAIAVAIFSAVCFFTVGFLGNWAGARIVARHVAEAAAFERVDMVAEAEKAYLKAIAIFDSFLVSPFMRAKKSRDLTERLARYYLIHSGDVSRWERFVRYHLKSHPNDEEVAEAWLRQIQPSRELDDEAYALVDRIGAHYSAGKTIQHLLVQLYLKETRTDAPAMRAYRRWLHGQPQAPAAMIAELSDVLLHAGKSDEFALLIYLAAYRHGARRDQLRRGVAACVQDIVKTPQNQAPLGVAQKLLAGIDVAQLEDMRATFNGAVHTPVPKESPRLLFLRRCALAVLNAVAAFGKAAGIRLSAGAKVFWGHTKVFWRYTKKQVLHGYRVARRSPKTKPILKWSLAAGLSALTVFLAVNTTIYLFKSSKDPATESVRAGGSLTTGKFTIQVAAYIKVEQAQRYADKLRKAGLAAYWIETMGKHRKWYQVRIARFEDKLSARKFGDRLKSKNIIDDYYIANRKSG